MNRHVGNARESHSQKKKKRKVGGVVNEDKTREQIMGLVRNNAAESMEMNRSALSSIVFANTTQDREICI